MDKIYIKARAKINLNLYVLDKRKDNYHNLESVFQKINLYDELYIEKNKEEKFEIKTNLSNIEIEDNIIYKAYIRLKEEFNQIKGVKVTLNKRIPMQAGLGGGSADCANFIIAMNKLYNLNLSKEKLLEIGRTLGADVIPCYYNKAVKAEGIGDIISEINTIFKYYILIIKPTLSCNTRQMFMLLDENKKENKITKKKTIIKALEEKNINLLSKNLYNDFETVIDKNIINSIKSALLKNGAIGASLTGSGSCVYGIFKNKLEAKNAYDELKKTYEIYICTSYNRSR